MRRTPIDAHGLNEDATGLCEFVSIRGRPTPYIYASPLWTPVWMGPNLCKFLCVSDLQGAKRPRVEHSANYRGAMLLSMKVGKIGRLPRVIREQVNRRLQNDEPDVSPFFSIRPFAVVLVSDFEFRIPPRSTQHAPQ